MGIVQKIVNSFGRDKNPGNKFSPTDKAEPAPSPKPGDMSATQKRRRGEK